MYHSVNGNNGNLKKINSQLFYVNLCLKISNSNMYLRIHIYFLFVKRVKSIISLKLSAFENKHDMYYLNVILPVKLICIHIKLIQLCLDRLSPASD